MEVDTKPGRKRDVEKADVVAVAMARAQADASSPADPRALTARLTALENLLKDTEDRLPAPVADEVGRILLRVHERIALSPDHVVTAIAGATGSGKSSLFNALIRFDLAPVGAIRPTTTAGLACIWDPDRAEGAAALLDRIGVATHNRTLRGSLLDGAHRRAQPQPAPPGPVHPPGPHSALPAHR